MNKVVIFWFRRDLRLHDNTALFHALSNSETVLPIFIFDTHILNDLKNKKDKRVDFIHQNIILALGRILKLFALAGCGIGSARLC